MNAKEMLFNAMVGIYEDVTKMVTETGETIVPGSGHILYSQYTGLYFAELFTNNRFPNPYYMDPKVLEQAIKCWEYFYTLTDSDGKTRLVTYDNYWGLCVDEWGVFHWMNTLELLKDYLDPKIIDKWNDRIDTIMLKNVVPGVKRQLYSNRFRYDVAQHEVSNHFCWHVTAAYRYGQLRQDRSIMDIADEVMNLIADGQTISGTWYEGKTLVSKYATVTIGALSKYYFLSGNKKILHALQKSLSYISKLLYPDFSVSAAIDTRNRYSKAFAPMHFPAAYSLFEEGNQVVSAFVKAVCDALSRKPFKGSTQGLAMLVENYRHIQDDFQVLPMEKFTLYKDTVRMPEEKVLILKKGDWVVDMCCQPVRVFGSRWILERQNLFAVYRDQSGLVIGGGHSIAQPELSCFNVISAGKLYYTHEEGNLTDANDGMDLVYGNRKCKIRFCFEEDALKIRYSVEGLTETERAYVHIPFFVALDEKIGCCGKEITLSKEPFACGIPEGGSLMIKGRTVTLSEEGLLRYPILPYNSYIVNHEKSFNEIFAIITVEFEHNKHELTVTVK
ncbi:MAG: hypothetical protein ACOX3Q_10410 [Clostridia bacterium]|jgi:hypothetical protein